MPKQRYAIYAVEDELRGNFTTPEGMQAWLDWICRTKWWRERSKIKHIQVVYPVVGKMSGATKLGPHLAKIDFAPFSLDQLTACHEITHVLTWDAEADPEDDHGPKFVAMELQVVRRFMSASFARNLAAKFDGKGVKYSAWE